MSTFFRYDTQEIAKIYDRERFPKGADVIAGLLPIHCGKQLKDIFLLDAGCGTGNYAKSLIAFGIGRITLIDASFEMLAVAKEKLKKELEKNIIDGVIQMEFPPFPFSDGTFDAVMFNQVLHHLDKTWAGSDHNVLELALQDAKRILRPRGVIIITTSLPSTIREAVWFHKIHPGITEKIQKAYISAEQYLDLFSKHGFECVSAMNLLSATTVNRTQLVNYFDCEGPLKEEWRKGTNVYEIASENEIHELEESLHRIKLNGSLQQFMIDNDRTLDMGILTVFVCISV